MVHETIVSALPALASSGCSKSTLESCHSAIANIDLKGRFQPSADISGQTTVKSSIQRGIRSAILSSWKIDVETLEEIWPKKESIVHVKWSVASVRVNREDSRFICSHLFFGFTITDPTAEIICQSTRCTASPSFSSTSTGHISPLCVFSTNASDYIAAAAAAKKRRKKR
jgi:hypothetical protein